MDKEQMNWLKNSPEVRHTGMYSSGGPLLFYFLSRDNNNKRLRSI